MFYIVNDHRPDRNSKYCTFCQRAGHDVAECRKRKAQSQVAPQAKTAKTNDWQVQCNRYHKFDNHTPTLDHGLTTGWPFVRPPTAKEIERYWAYKARHGML